MIQSNGHTKQTSIVSCTIVETKNLKHDKEKKVLAIVPAQISEKCPLLSSKRFQESNKSFLSEELKPLSLPLFDAENGHIKLKYSPEILLTEIENEKDNRYLFKKESNQLHSSSQFLLDLINNDEKRKNDETSTIASHSNFELPTDITNISIETDDIYNDSKDLKYKLVIKRKVPFVGYLILFSALITISSIGAALDMETEVDPLIKLFWRTSATSCAFFPLALYSLYRSNINIIYLFQNVTLNHVIHMIICSVAYAYYISSFLIALDLTSVGHAYIFNNSHSLLIVLSKIILRLPISKLEGIGAILGVTGGAITSFDTTKTYTSGHNNSFIGDFIALSGAVGGVIYLTKAKILRSTIPVFLFMWLLSLFTCMTVFTFLFIRQNHFSFDKNIYYGLFGWLNNRMNRLPIELYIVFVCDFIGTMGYISVMKYFDPIVVSIVMLLEPIIATFLGILVGVDYIPGYLTFIGGFILLLGTFFVIYSHKTKKEEINMNTTDISQNNSVILTPIGSLNHLLSFQLSNRSKNISFQNMNDNDDTNSLSNVSDSMVSSI